MTAAAGPADGHLWPNAEQQLLLDAALALDDARARDAWRAWRARVDVEAEFGWAALRLLPLVYRNLLRLGVDDPLLGRLKGTYRRAFYETHQLRDRARPAVAALRAAGVDVLVLKGAALGVSYYDTLAQRPMRDLDLCVRPSDARRAIDAVRTLGWRLRGTPTDDLLRFSHEIQAFAPSGARVDLHWHAIPEGVGNDLDDAFWADTEPFDYNGLPARQLAPTSLLLHTVSHGVRWNPEPPVRWIPDALGVLRRRGSEVDWDRFVALARRGRLTHRLALGLDYLVRHYEAPVPAATLARLARTRVTLPERMERTVLLRNHVRLRSGAMGQQWCILVELARRVHPVRQPLAFAATYPRYLQYRMSKNGRRRLLPRPVRGVARWLVGRPSPRSSAPGPGIEARPTA